MDHVCDMCSKTYKNSRTLASHKYTAHKKDVPAKKRRATTDDEMSNSSYYSNDYSDKESRRESASSENETTDYYSSENEELGSRKREKLIRFISTALLDGTIPLTRSQNQALRHMTWIRDITHRPDDARYILKTKAVEIRKMLKIVLPILNNILL